MNPECHNCGAPLDDDENTFCYECLDGPEDVLLETSPCPLHRTIEVRGRKRWGFTNFVDGVIMVSDSRHTTRQETDR